MTDLLSILDYMFSVLAIYHNFDDNSQTAGEAQFCILLAEFDEFCYKIHYGFYLYLILQFPNKLLFLEMHWNHKSLLDLCMFDIMFQFYYIFFYL